jgi:hypothetical protein
MSEEVPVLLEQLLIAKRKLREQTREIEGVEGCGTDGKALRIYVSDEKIVPRLPRLVDGFAVNVIPSGRIRAQLGAI